MRGAARAETRSGQAVSWLNRSVNYLGRSGYCSAIVAVYYTPSNSLSIVRPRGLDRHQRDEPAAGAAFEACTKSVGSRRNASSGLCHLAANRTRMAWFRRVCNRRTIMRRANKTPRLGGVGVRAGDQRVSRLWALCAAWMESNTCWFRTALFLLPNNGKRFRACVPENMW